MIIRPASTSWNITGGARAELLHVLTGHIQADYRWTFPGLTAVAFSPDGHKLATGGVDGFAKVWQVESGQELLSVQGHPMGLGITNLAFSPDNRYLATTSDQGSRDRGRCAGKDLGCCQRRRAAYL
jgi:WD40 repeat protein